MIFGHSAKGVGIAAAGLIVTSVGGALLSKIDRWYFMLRKPSWQPPALLFGPVWTTIFALTGFSFVRSWDRVRTDAARARLTGLFYANFGFNALWSYLFFTRRRPDLALLEIAPLVASIVLLIITTAPLDRHAALALVPYLAWVSFAAVLNATIVRLNAPFAKPAATPSAP